MSHLLGDAGRAFLKAFAATLFVVLIGVSSQTNLDAALGFGVAGLAASLAAGLAAIQVFIPSLSFRAAVPGALGPMLDSFAHAFLGAFVVAVTGWLAEPNYSAWKAVLIGAIVGAINAGLRAVQGGLTTGESPAPQNGVRTSARAGAANGGIPPA